MSRREVAFLLLGLGVGLMFAVLALVELALSFHRMFIVGIRWTPASVVLAIPFLLVLSGVLILYRGRVRQNLN
jgi:hypothetical protein